MASVDNVLGLRGRLGNVVFCERNGKSYTRGIPTEVYNPNTPKQQAVRSRFRVAVRFFQKLKDTPILDVLNGSAEGIAFSGYNFFMKKNLKAFKADGKIGDFSQIHFAAGKRQEMYNLTGEVDERDEVTLRWENSPRANCTEREDRLMVVVLYGDRAFSPLVLEGVNAIRKECKAAFGLSRKKGVKAHLYCFFVSSKKRYSSSQYISL